MLRRGFLYWASVPGDKRRPVLLISPNARNDRAADVIVVPLSTVLRPGPWHVRLRRGDGGLRQASVVKCEQVMTVRKETLSPEPIGQGLSVQQIAEVERAIMRAIGIPVYES